MNSVVIWTYPSMCKSNGHGDIYETYNFSFNNTYQGLQQIQEISFKMKQEPSKITMKEVHNLETNSSTKMRNSNEWAEMNKIKIKMQRKVSKLGGGIDKHQRLNEQMTAHDKEKMISEQSDNLYEFQVI